MARTKFFANQINLSNTEVNSTIIPIDTAEKGVHIGAGIQVAQQFTVDWQHGDIVLKNENIIGPSDIILDGSSPSGWIRILDNVTGNQSIEMLNGGSNQMYIDQHSGGLLLDVSGGGGFIIDGTNGGGIDITLGSSSGMVITDNNTGHGGFQIDFDAEGSGPIEMRAPGSTISLINKDVTAHSGQINLRNEAQAGGGSQILIESVYDTPIIIDGGGDIDIFTGATGGMRIHALGGSNQNIQIESTGITSMIAHSTNAGGAIKIEASSGGMDIDGALGIWADSSAGSIIITNGDSTQISMPYSTGDWQIQSGYAGGQIYTSINGVDIRMQDGGAGSYFESSGTNTKLGMYGGGAGGFVTLDDSFSIIRLEEGGQNHYIQIDGTGIYMDATTNSGSFNLDADNIAITTVTGFSVTNSTSGTIDLINNATSSGINITNNNHGNIFVTNSYGNGMVKLIDATGQQITLNDQTDGSRMVFKADGPGLRTYLSTGAGWYVDSNGGGINWNIGSSSGVNIADGGNSCGGFNVDLSGGGGHIYLINRDSGYNVYSSLELSVGTGSSQAQLWAYDGINNVYSYVQLPNTDSSPLYLYNYSGVSNAYSYMTLPNSVGSTSDWYNYDSGNSVYSYIQLYNDGSGMFLYTYNGNAGANQWGSRLDLKADGTYLELQSFDQGVANETTRLKLASDHTNYSGAELETNAGDIKLINSSTSVSGSIYITNNSGGGKIRLEETSSGGNNYYEIDHSGTIQRLRNDAGGLQIDTSGGAGCTWDATNSGGVQIQVDNGSGFKVYDAGAGNGGFQVDLQSTGNGGIQLQNLDTNTTAIRFYALNGGIISISGNGYSVGNNTQGQMNFTNSASTTPGMNFQETHGNITMITGTGSIDITPQGRLLLLSNSSYVQLTANQNLDIDVGTSSTFDTASGMSFTNSTSGAISITNSAGGIDIDSTLGFSVLNAAGASQLDIVNRGTSGLLLQNRNNNGNLQIHNYTSAGNLIIQQQGGGGKVQVLSDGGIDITNTVLDRILIDDSGNGAMIIRKSNAGSLTIDNNISGGNFFVISQGNLDVDVENGITIDNNTSGNIAITNSVAGGSLNIYNDAGPGGTGDIQIYSGRHINLANFTGDIGIVANQNISIGTINGTLQVVGTSTYISGSTSGTASLNGATGISLINTTSGNIVITNSVTDGQIQLATTGTTDEIDLTATTIDINGDADVSGTLTMGEIEIPTISGSDPADSPNAGTARFRTDTDTLWIYNGSSWVSTTLT